MEKMKRFKRRLSQTLRGSHTIDESLSELAEQMTIEENGLKDSGASCFNLMSCSGVFSVNSISMFYHLSKDVLSGIQLSGFSCFRFWQPSYFEGE